MSLTTGVTAEEVTAKRRAERRQFKLDRARAIAAAAMEAEAAFETHGVVPSETSVVIPSAATWRPSKPAQDAMTPPETIEGPVSPAEVGAPVGQADIEEEELEDLEHLQLTLQEAFFLLWSLDCLSILSPTTVSIQFQLCNIF